MNPWSYRNRVAGQHGQPGEGLRDFFQDRQEQGLNYRVVLRMGSRHSIACVSDWTRPASKFGDTGYPQLGVWTKLVVGNKLGGRSVLGKIRNFTITNLS